MRNNFENTLCIAHSNVVLIIFTYSKVIIFIESSLHKEKLSNLLFFDLNFIINLINYDFFGRLFTINFFGY